MKPGRHAAGDGSFARSAGTAMGRGVLLLAVALALGIVLLQTTDEPAEQVRAGPSRNTEPTRGAARTTTTLTPPPTSAPVRAPRDVKVAVANGTRTKGAAGRMRDRLLGAQYNVVAALDTKAPAGQSNVYYTAGFDREAAALAQLLGLQAAAAQPMPDPPPVTDLKGASVLVVLGPDLAQQAGGTTTTTAARASTTTTARARAASTTSTIR